MTGTGQLNDGRLEDVIAEAWGWLGLQPKAVIQTNSFGSTLVEDADGQIWRIVPDIAECEIIAENRLQLDDVVSSDEFALEWSMGELLPLANATVGPLSEGECYWFQMPPFLGGQYVADNLCKVPVREALFFAGEAERQMKDLPDGAEFKLKIVE